MRIISTAIIGTTIIISSIYGGVGNIIHAEDTNPLIENKALTRQVIIDSNQFVSDDIGVASPQAITQAQATKFAALPLAKTTIAAHTQWFNSEMSRLAPGSGEASSRLNVSLEKSSVLTSKASSSTRTEILNLKKQMGNTAAKSMKYSAIEGESNGLDMSRAVHGNILLGAHNEDNPDAIIPGFFEHAALWSSPPNMSTRFPVLQATPPQVMRSEGNYFRDHYTWAAILGVYGTSPNSRNAVINYATKQIGKPYYMWGQNDAEDTWYCSKLVWRAYEIGLGVDLSDGARWFGWVLPDHIWYSDNTYVRATSW